MGKLCSFQSGSYAAATGPFVHLIHPGAPQLQALSVPPQADSLGSMRHRLHALIDGLDLGLPCLV